MGALLINPEIYSTIDLRADEFYIQRNGWIWRAIADLYLRDSAIDFETVSDELNRKGQLSQIGGGAYLAELITKTPTSLHAESYAQIVRDYHRRRQLMTIASKIAKMALDKDSKIEDEIVTIIDDLARNAARPDGAAHWRKYYESLYDDIIARMSNPKAVWGIPTGFAKFDRITGGLQPNEMLLFSGKPGIGKSIWVMQAAEQMAHYAPGAIYSVEMPGVQTVRRTLSGKTKIEVSKMKSGEIIEKESQLIAEMLEELCRLPVYMSDASNWSTSALRADLQRLKIRHKIQWFVFDYMMLAGDGQGLGITERTSMLSRNFKLICRQLGLAGIVIHSMRKSGMEQSSPEQQDLFGGGQSIYDADLICFLNEFIPMTPSDNSIAPAEAVNIRTLTFGKGRELENPKRYIHMVKRPGFPVFGDMED
ncbi:MAG: replicative DNA helicase [Candidatus Omnitrophica bacterium]|nr:replicative DNA helicase [Candidatus Omnitrophota bacterium]